MTTGRRVRQNENKGAEMRTHELKTDPAVFEAVARGDKTHEIRLNDRGFAVGDTLLLRETESPGEYMKLGSPLVYTGRTETRTISHIQTGYGLADDWCILSFAATPPSTPSNPQAGQDHDRVQWWLALQRIPCPYNEREHGPNWQGYAHVWTEAIIAAMRVIDPKRTAPPQAPAQGGTKHAVDHAETRMDTGFEGGPKSILAHVKPWEARYRDDSWGPKPLLAVRKIGYMESEIADWRAWGAALAAQQEAQGGAVRDSERLDFLIHRGARVSHSMDGETCNVWLPAERDGTEARPAEGYPQRHYDDGRKAIDAAMVALRSTHPEGKE